MIEGTKFVRLPNCYVGCTRVECVYCVSGICPTPFICKGNSDAMCHELPNYKVLTWLILDED